MKSTLMRRLSILLVLAMVLAMLPLGAMAADSTVLYLSAITGIDRSQYEAAAVDGATKWQQMIHVTVPMVRPVAFFVFINTMIESFKTFEQVKLMTGGDPLYSTTTIVHQIYQRGFAEFKMGYAAAMSVVLLLIVLVVTIVNYRFGSGAEQEG